MNYIVTGLILLVLLIVLSSPQTYRRPVTPENANAAARFVKGGKVMVQ